MGFEFPADIGGGGSWVGTQEKKDLLADSTVINIKAVLYDEFNTFEGRPSPRYVVLFDLDGEERQMGFAIGSVTTRDKVLAAAQAYLDNDADEGETIPVTLAKAGQAWLLEDASASV